MNIERKMFFIVLLVFFLLGFMLPAVCAGGDEEIVQETELKTIRIAFTTPPQTLDPFKHRNRNTQLILRTVFDALGGNLYDGSMCLELAESIVEVEPGIYEVKIPRGVTFHNGDPLTADDVIFTMKRLSTQEGMEGETSIRLPLTAELSFVEKIDDYTVRVSYEPSVRRGTWYHNEILPKKYFEEIGPEEFAKHPVGAGAFKFVETDMSSYAIFERHDNYYGGPAIYKEGIELDRVPAVDRIIFSFISEPTTRVAALLAGEIDIMQTVPPDLVSLIVNNPDTRVEGTPGTSTVTLFLNTTKPPFDDKRVRQAIAYAIDYDLLVEQLLLGFSDPQYGLPFVMPFSDEFFHAQELFPKVKSPYQYDPEKAKALLSEAGVSELSTVIDTYGVYVEQAQVIAQMLGEVGIDASVRVWEQAVITEEFKKKQRDMYYAPVGNGAKTPSWIYRLTSGQALDHSFYYNKEFEDLILKAEALGDSAEQAQLLVEAFEIILEDIPLITVHVPYVLYACRENVKNFKMHFADRVYYHILDIE